MKLISLLYTDSGMSLHALCKTPAFGSVISHFDPRFKLGELTFSYTKNKAWGVLKFLHVHVISEVGSWI